MAKVTRARLWKVITPAALNKPAMRRAIQDAMNDIVDGMEADFQETVATWDHRPDFYRSATVNEVTHRATAEVSTDDEQYLIVNEGAKPHPIFPKKPGGLIIYQGDFAPKTNVGDIASYDGGKSGEYIFRDYIPEHPGFKGRKFDKAIEKKWRPEFRRKMDEAMGRVAKASDNSMTTPNRSVRNPITPSFDTLQSLGQRFKNKGRNLPF